MLYPIQGGQTEQPSQRLAEQRRICAFHAYCTPMSSGNFHLLFNLHDGTRIPTNHKPESSP